MSKNEFMVDLHCHPNIKAFHSGHPKPKRNLWESIEHEYSDSGFMRVIKKNSSHILKESQCNLNSMVEGKVRVANISLYPFEHGFLNLRDVPGLMLGKNTYDMTAFISGIDSKRTKYLAETDDRYFKDLVAEYEYVRDSQGKSPDGKNSFQLVNNYKELKEVLKDPDAIAGIMSIEGSHSFGSGYEGSEKFGIEEHKAIMTENIRKVKNWEFPPFTVNLAHHFWNQNCGHARSIKPPINGLLNQNKGLDKGLTELGRHVVRELLSRENGKRILIDVKHMSVASRLEYYGFIRNYNYLQPEDKIPVIASHAGVNGYKDLRTSNRKRDSAAKSKKSTLHKWSINLNNEELRIIHESEGLVGVMMDKGLLGGQNLIDKISAYESEEKQRAEFCRLIWLNIFQMVEAVDAVTGWDVPAIGTDYDGTITHIDPYDTAAKMPMLRQDLIDYLEEHKLKKDLWYDYSPTQLVNKIMNGNAMNFYKKYFV